MMCWMIMSGKSLRKWQKNDQGRISIILHRDLHCSAFYNRRYQKQFKWLNIGQSHTHIMYG